MGAITVHAVKAQCRTCKHITSDHAALSYWERTSLCPRCDRVNSRWWLDDGSVVTMSDCG